MKITSYKEICDRIDVLEKDKMSLYPHELGLNMNFKIFFHPKDSAMFKGKRRLAIGVYSLHKYIGQVNAFNAMERAKRNHPVNISIKLRKFGILKIYCK